MRYALGVLLAALALGAPALEDVAISAFSAMPPGSALPAGWRKVVLPYGNAADFSLVRDAGQTVLQVRSRTFVEAAICAGNSELRAAFAHVMPNALAPALVHFSTTIGFSILLTAGLSFVGAGVPPPTPELGLMIQVGAQNMITGHWWTALFPGLMLAVSVLAFSLFGDHLRVFLDPTNRR